MKDLSMKRLSELKMGDEIMTNVEGALKPDVFIGFLHKNIEKNAEYLDISFENSK